MQRVSMKLECVILLLCLAIAHHSGCLGAEPQAGQTRRHHAMQEATTANAAPRDDYYPQDWQLGRLRYWQLLMNNPTGRAECSGSPSLENGVFNCGPASEGSICTGTCQMGYHPEPQPIVRCKPSGQWGPVEGQCVRDPCFSGDALVRVQNMSTPVAMRDLRTGQFVQCLESGVDLTRPSTLKWCKVMNWLHAQSLTYTQRRITFSRVGAATGSITLANIHLVLRLTSATPAGTTKADIKDFGSFETVPARDISAGDRLVVLEEPSKEASDFIVAAVTEAAPVVAEGMYIPMIEMPYIVVDGAVMPLYTESPLRMVAPPEVLGPLNMVSHYGLSPLWMQRMQEWGTPGTSGDWDGSPVWPGQTQLSAVFAKHAMRGEQLNFTAAQEWFTQLYQDWQADPSAAVTLEQVLAQADDNRPGSPWIRP